MLTTYGAAEEMLGRLHGADENSQRGVLRGRLKHLKRLGIPLGSNPGKGQKTSYNVSDLYQWAFCLDLEEFGMDPTLIVAIVRSLWDPFIFPAYKDALVDLVDNNKETLFAFNANVLFSTVAKNSSPLDNFACVSSLEDIREAGLLSSRTHVCFFSLKPALEAVEALQSSAGNDGNARS